METYDSKLEPLNIDLPQNFQQFVPHLIKKFNPAKLICFACVKERATAEGTFISVTDEKMHIFLLMVTTDYLPREKKVQSWIEKKYKENKVTILVHKLDHINYELKQSYSLINTAFRIGICLYTTEGMPLPHELQKGIDEDEYKDNTLGARILGADYHKDLAENFRETAGLALEHELWNVSSFLYSEAVQQYCLALIDLFLDLKPRYQSPRRLLDICRCFTLELDKVFQSEVDGDLQLFTFIQDARIIIHHGADITPGDELVYQIDELVTKFRKIALGIYKEKAKEIKAIAKKFRKEQKAKDALLVAPLE